MKILDELIKQTEELQHEVETAILNNNFSVISVGNHTTRIEVLNMNIEIWMSNGAEHTEIVRIEYKGRDRGIPISPFVKANDVHSTILSKSPIGKDTFIEEHY